MRLPFFTFAKIASGIPYAVQATQDLDDYDSGVPVEVVSEGEDEDFHYWRANAGRPDPDKGVYIRLLVIKP